RRSACSATTIGRARPNNFPKFPVRSEILRSLPASVAHANWHRRTPHAHQRSPHFHYWNTSAAGLRIAAGSGAVLLGDRLGRKQQRRDADGQYSSINAATWHRQREYLNDGVNVWRNMVGWRQRAGVLLSRTQPDYRDRVCLLHRVWVEESSGYRDGACDTSTH